MRHPANMGLTGLDPVAASDGPRRSAINGLTRQASIFDAALGIADMMITV
jgi:hypothetical protein